MSNVHLPFVSVYQRMTDFVQTLAYAGVIRNSVTGVLVILFCFDNPTLMSRNQANMHARVSTKPSTNYKYKHSN